VPATTVAGGLGPPVLPSRRAEWALGNCLPLFR
jgi:hypothetical protein